MTFNERLFSGHGVGCLMVPRGIPGFVLYLLLMASGPRLAFAQPTSPGPDSDPEWLALSEQLKRPDLAGLQGAERIPLGRLIARQQVRGAWLVAQATQWKSAMASSSAELINRTVDQFIAALPSVRGGAPGAGAEDVRRWQDLLTGLKVLAQTLLDLVDPAALKSAVNSGTWVAPQGELSNGDWVKLWGRGLDNAELKKLGNRGAQFRISKSIEDLFKTLEGPRTPTFLGSHNTLITLQNEQATLGSDALTRNVMHIALALQGRAIGADEAMLAGAGLRTIPATSEAWLAVAADFETASAWRFATLAKMLAAFSSGGSAASLTSEYQQRFRDQSRVDQRITQWLSGAGRGAGLAPFGISLKYDSAGAAERGNCASATADAFLSGAQSAKAVLLGGLSGSPVTSSGIQAIIAGNKGAVVEIVQTGPGQFSACMVGKSGATNTTFSSPSDLFSRIASWRGGDRLDGLLIAPDRGMWPDGNWYRYCKDSGAATWFAVIPSSGTVVRGSKWNQDALKRLYYLDRMQSRNMMPKPESLTQPSIGSGALSQRGFTQINLWGAGVSGTFEAWDTIMTQAASKADFPFLVWIR